jgi:hypothetical protein
VLQLCAYVFQGRHARIQYLHARLQASRMLIAAPHPQTQVQPAGTQRREFQTRGILTWTLCATPFSPVLHCQGSAQGCQSSAMQAVAGATHHLQGSAYHSSSIKEPALPRMPAPSQRIRLQTLEMDELQCGMMPARCGNVLCMRSEATQYCRFKQSAKVCLCMFHTLNLHPSSIHDATSARSAEMCFAWQTAAVGMYVNTHLASATAHPLLRDDEDP